MDFNNFETKFFSNLKNENENYLEFIDNNRDLIESFNGLNGNTDTLNEFLNKLINFIVYDIKVESIFSAIENILKHPVMAKVLEFFQQSNILIKVCENSVKKITRSNKLNDNEDSINNDFEKIDKNLIKWLFTINIDPCVQNEEGITALMFSAQYPELLFVVKYLIKNSPQCLSLQDKKGENALFYSLRNPVAFKELIKSEIDVNQQNIFGETALIYCCKNEIYEMIPELLNNRRDINVNQTDKEDRTAAMYLAEKGRNKEFRALNLRCCFYDYKNHKNESVISILIKKLYSTNGNKRLSSELLTEYCKILLGLVIFNCDFDLPVDEDENTALMAILLARDFYTIYCVLQNSENYNLSTQNRYGESASSLCMKSNNSAFFFPLMFKHPTFDFKYIDIQTGNTMLMYSAIAHPQCINKIVKHSVNTINVTNKKNETALILAAKINNKKSIIELLNQSVNNDKQDHLGNTALHYAVKNKEPEIVNQLLIDFANRDIKNNEGKTALQLAHEINDKTILNYMENNRINYYDNNNNSIEIDEESNKRSMVEDISVLEYLYPWITRTYEDFKVNSEWIEIEKSVYGCRVEDFHFNIEDINNENSSIWEVYRFRLKPSNYELKLKESC